MLDGKAEVPGMMSREDISTLLDRTRAAREQFLGPAACSAAKYRSGERDWLNLIRSSVVPPIAS